MTPTTPRAPAPARSDVDPALRPFLDEVATMLAERLLAEHRRRTAEMAGDRDEEAA